MRVAGLTKIGKELAEIKKKKPERGIHSEKHALAKEISEYAGEPKKFAMYLGIIKNIGLRKAYRIFSKIKQSKSVKTPGKLFVYESRMKQDSERVRGFIRDESSYHKKTKRNIK